jgi:ABC-type antimicrobial peptide transport system permease subunit
VPMIYLPAEQSLLFRDITFELRTANDATSASPAVLRAIAQVDARLSVTGMKTLNEQLDGFLIQQRLVASMAGLFGILAISLVSIGLYGVIAYSVNHRTNEIGIRMALGSSRARIAAMVLNESSKIVLAGFALGIPAAILTTQLVRTELYGLRSYDFPIMLLAMGILVAAALLASYFPAMQAARVDPIVALRHH